VGEAAVNAGGELRKAYFFVLALPHSDALFVQAFWHARTEMWWEFHKRAFEYLDGVPRRISYDNDKCLVSAVTGKRARRQSGSLDPPGSFSCKATTFSKSISAA
jgi:transposase